MFSSEVCIPTAGGTITPASVDFYSSEGLSVNRYEYYPQTQTLGETARAGTTPTSVGYESPLFYEKDGQLVPYLNKSGGPTTLNNLIIDEGFPLPEFDLYIEKEISDGQFIYVRLSSLEPAEAEGGMLRRAPVKVTLNESQALNFTAGQSYRAEVFNLESILSGDTETKIAQSFKRIIDKSTTTQNPDELLTDPDLLFLRDKLAQFNFSDGEYASSIRNDILFKEKAPVIRRRLIFLRDQFHGHLEDIRANISALPDIDHNPQNYRSITILYSSSTSADFGYYLVSKDGPAQLYIDNISSLANAREEILAANESLRPAYTRAVNAEIVSQINEPDLRAGMRPNVNSLIGPTVEEEAAGTTPQAKILYQALGTDNVVRVNAADLPKELASSKLLARYQDDPSKIARVILSDEQKPIGAVLINPKTKLVTVVTTPNLGNQEVAKVISQLKAALPEGFAVSKTTQKRFEEALGTNGLKVDPRTNRLVWIPDIETVPLPSSPFKRPQLKPVTVSEYTANITNPTSTQIRRGRMAALGQAENLHAFALQNNQGDNLGYVLYNSRTNTLLDITVTNQGFKQEEVIRAALTASQQNSSDTGFGLSKDLSAKLETQFDTSTLRSFGLYKNYDQALAVKSLDDTSLVQILRQDASALTIIAQSSTKVRFIALGGATTLFLALPGQYWFRNTAIPWIAQQINNFLHPIRPIPTSSQQPVVWTQVSPEPFIEGKTDLPPPVVENKPEETQTETPPPTKEKNTTDNKINTSTADQKGTSLNDNSKPLTPSHPESEPISYLDPLLLPTASVVNPNGLISMNQLQNVPGNANEFFNSSRIALNKGSFDASGNFTPDSAFRGDYNQIAALSKAKDLTFVLELNNLNEDSPEKVQRMLQSFLSNFAQRGNLNSISRIIIGNENDVRQLLTGEVYPPEEYVAQLEAAYKTIKEINPNIKVFIYGDTAFEGDINPTPDYLEDVIAMTNSFDGVTSHIQQLPSETILTRKKAYELLLAKYDRTNKEFMVDEMSLFAAPQLPQQANSYDRPQLGWVEQTQGNKLFIPQGLVNYKEYANFIVQTASLAVVTNTTVNLLGDLPDQNAAANVGDLPIDTSFFNKDQPTEAYRAAININKIVSNTQHSRFKRDGNRVWVTLDQPDGSIVNIIWNESAKEPQPIPLELLKIKGIITNAWGEEMSGKTKIDPATNAYSYSEVVIITIPAAYAQQGKTKL